MRLVTNKMICALLVASIAINPAMAKKKPKPVPPPPAVKVIPPPPPQPIRPYPPGGAAPNIVLPAKDPMGVWTTPNLGLTRNEALWNFRSAINVAALVCRGIPYANMTPNYNKLLAKHKTKLATVNRAIDAEYKKRFPGKNALRLRDTRSTALYNFYALPAVHFQFCDAALVKVTETLDIPSTALSEYSVGALADIDQLFQDFYSQYAQYQVQYSEYLLKLDAWNLQYGPKPVAPMQQPLATPTAADPVPPPKS